MYMYIHVYLFIYFASIIKLLAHQAKADKLETPLK